MFNIGELVINRKTGNSGTVYNYGHQIVGNVYMPTLIVRVSDAAGENQSQFIEDLASEWTQLSNHELSEAANNN